MVVKRGPLGDTTDTFMRIFTAEAFGFSVAI